MSKVNPSKGTHSLLSLSQVHVNEGLLFIIFVAFVLHYIKVILNAIWSIVIISLALTTMLLTIIINTKKYAKETE